MRPPDWQKWELAWDHMAAGKSKKTSGIDKNLAGAMRRLQELGWAWEDVYARLRADPIGLNGLVAETEGGTPPPAPGTNPKPSPSRQPAPLKPPPAAFAAPPAQRPVADPSQEIERETFADRQRTRVERQRAHWEREMQAGAKLMDLADRLLEAHKPYILERKKVSRRQDACPHCRKEVVVEEVHIHPAKVDVQGIVQAYREGAERTRVALALPRQMLAVHVSDVHAELSERLEAIDEAFKLAFRHGIERGLLSEASALEIWDVARNKIGGIA